MISSRGMKHGHHRLTAIQAMIAPLVQWLREGMITSCAWRRICMQARMSVHVHAHGAARVDQRVLLVIFLFLLSSVFCKLTSAHI